MVEGATLVATSVSVKEYVFLFCGQGGNFQKYVKSNKQKHMLKKIGNIIAIIKNIVVVELHLTHFQIEIQFECNKYKQ